ncbi:MAG: hypothetical protein E7311_03930 [Clostridiales bacterium]|nr:hypothetical protein [Clostridiales bacterium]
MYNIITGIGNENINNELRKLEKYNILFGDIAYQEAVLDVISKNNIDKLVIYDELDGELDKKEFIEAIIDTKQNIDIIIILDKENKEFINFLISKGIFKIINSEEITLELLCKNIDNEIENPNEKKLYNQIIDLKEKLNNTKNLNSVTIRNVLDKKIITVNGLSGSGKSTFVSNLAITIAKEYNKKVLIIDLDTTTANIDKILGVNKLNKEIICNLDNDKRCVLNYMVDCIQKDNLDYDIFEKSVITYPKEKNVSIITGNNSMFVCQSILCDNYYNQILNKAKQLYDYIVIDTNSSLFLDSTKWALENADLIYYIFQGNYTDISNMKNILYIYTKAWNVLFNKIKFILNKQTRFSLNRQSINDIEKDLEIVQVFDYKDKYIESINNNVPIVFTDIIEKQKYQELLGIYDKKPIFSKLSRAIKEVF